jgi:hypothetical protein
MNYPDRAPGKARRHPIAVAVSICALLAALIAAPAADAKPKGKKSVPVEVMTRNIFLGADLGPALNASSAAEFVAANGGILREVDQTNFPVRAMGLANEILDAKPDLVGIQEGAWWRTNPTPGAPHQGDDPDFIATTTKYDFLQLLLDQLNANTNKNYKGYELAVVGREFDFEAPTDYDGNPATGLLGGEIQGRLTMRDAILVRKGSGVKVSNPQSGHFQNLFTPVISGITVPVTRGWVSVDAKATKGKGKKKRSVKFRFVNTHFEAFDDETQRPSIRALQAQELVSGPANGKRVILVGDLNSNVPGVQPGDEQAYEVVLGAGFVERGATSPPSCCVPSVITGPASEFDHQVDHVMTNQPKKVKLARAEVTGLEPVNGFFNSDHAGLFSKLKVR